MERTRIVDYEGPADWQIIQQENGVAAIRIAGRVVVSGLEPDGDKFVAAARLVREDSSHPVTQATDWQCTDQFDRSSGRFEHSFEWVPAGGLYRLEIGAGVDPSTDWPVIAQVVHCIGVGDLWVIAGQSNAAGIGTGLAEDPPELGVHMLRNDEQWSLAIHPLNDATGSTHPNVEKRPLHSPNLAFAKRLRRELNMPIGLIQTSLGGSPLAAWNPEENAFLYRNLLHCVRLAGGAIRGVIWYQGCSDTGVSQAETYADRFATMVNALRRDLDSPDLPVITTQLNKTWGGPNEEVDRGWSLMREAQRTMPGRIANLGVVPTVGLPLCDGIHNSTAGNLELGQRYAVTALGMVYGRPLPWRYPEPTEVTLRGDRRIVIRFEHVASHLSLIRPNAPDFRVEDEHGVVSVVEAWVELRDTLVLKLERAAAGGMHVSSCYGKQPDPSLFDVREHRPALGFTNVPVRLAR